MSALRIIAKTLLALILIALAAAVLVLLFLFLYPSVGQVPDKTEPDSGSDHWADGQFRNENDARTMTGDSAPGSNRKIQQKSHSGWNRAVIPDVAYWSCKLNVSCTFTAYLEVCYLNATAVTDYALVTD